MRKITGILILTALMSSCVKPMYYWGKYDDAVYSHQKNLDDRSAKKLVAAYADMVNNAKKGQRGVPPPGVYADYGFFLIQQGRDKQGERMIELEMKTYPESAFFIQQLLKMMSDGNEGGKKNSR
jgi:hypothetical protein